MKKNQLQKGTSPHLRDIYAMVIMGALLSFALTAVADSYTVKKDEFKSTRDQLRVLNAGTPYERRVTVHSECKKIGQTEAPYGECTHQITVAPRANKFVVKTGEEVVLAYFGGTLPDLPLVIATLKYGCCGGPNVIDFYSERGESLGSMATYETVIAFMDRVVQLNQVAGHRYAITGKSDPEKLNGTSTLQVWTVEKSGPKSAVPLKLNLPELNECVWTIKDTFLNSDTHLRMTFALAQCDHPNGEVRAECRKRATAWECRP